MSFLFPVLTSNLEIFTLASVLILSLFVPLKGRFSALLSLS